MRNTFLLTAFALFMTTSVCLARETKTIPVNDEVKDSLVINDAVVTGTRSQTEARNLPFSVEVISRKTIENRMSPSVLTSVEENVPGLFVTKRGVLGYGVSTGGSGAISYRGISSSIGRMMVMIDGHPQYMGIFGHPVADAYGTLMAERVEVVRGPASVLYGSNAMGGVINIITRQPQEDGVKTDAKLGYGSFGTFESEVVNRVKKGKFNSAVGVTFNRTNGHRDNMNFDEVLGFAKLGYDFSDHWKASLDFNISHSNSNSPGAESAPLVDGKQHITRAETSLSISNKYEKMEGSINFFMNLGNHAIEDGYIPSLGQSPKDYLFRSKDDMMGLNLFETFKVSRSTSLTAGFDLFQIDGSAWNEYYSDPTIDGDIVDKHETEVAGYLDLRQHAGDFLTFDAGVRVDNHSKVGTECIPMAGISAHLPSSIEMKLSASKGFRYPTIREMYMYPPQNPDLKPESMWNYEFAFSQHLLEGKLMYGINVFYLNAKNLIETIPNPSGTGRINFNSGVVKNWGVELQAKYSINQYWNVDLNYSFLRMMTTPVVAAPEHKLFAQVNFKKSRWYAGLGAEYINSLYTSVSPEEKQNFLLVNLRGSFDVLNWMTVWARCENLLNQKYEINSGYPMPGITASVGVKFCF